MNVETFFDKFELLADAPTSIARVRTLVLRLAIQGRLVEQCCDDAPATELVRRAINERKKLVERKVVRKEKHDLSFLDQPHELPAGWVQAPLAVYVAVIMGQSPPSSAYNKVGEGLPFYQGKAQFGDLHPTASDWCTEPKKIGEPGDVVISVRAPVGPTNLLREQSCIGRGLAALRSLGGEPMYLLYALRAVESSLASMGVGSTFVAISKTNLDSFTIPVPPLAEQKRIVAKVDALMALLDDLEARQQEREHQHTTLARAALARFADDPSPANLEYLFHNSYDINPADLRKSILNMAFHGRLVVRRPDEEVAPIEPRERDSKGEGPPFLIPRHWKWGSTVDAASDIVDCPHSTPKWTDTGKYCVRTTELNARSLNLSTSKFVSDATYRERIRRLRPEENDILYCREGQVGNACRVPPNVDLCLGQRMMLMRAAPHTDPAFFEYALNAPFTARRVASLITGMTAPRVNVRMVKDYWMPFPPLAEQRRIVAKVDRLMALVDELEARLTRSRQLAAELLAAVVHELTTAPASSAATTDLVEV